MKTISLAVIIKQAGQIITRYHVVIFVVLIFGGLAVAVLLLNDTVNRSSETGTYEQTLNASFDEKTIERIEQLKTRDEKAAPLDLSHGRTNPFIE